MEFWCFGSSADEDTQQTLLYEQLCAPRSSNVATLRSFEAAVCSVRRFHPPEVQQGMRDVAVAKERLTLACARALNHWMGQLDQESALMKAAVQVKPAHQ